MTTVYAIIFMTVLCGLCSLGADYGRVQLAKTELQRAADSVARAAVTSLSTGVTATQTAAVTWGAYNTVDGTALTIDPNNDVEFGTWTSNAFQPLTGVARANATAIRITARRTAATNTGIPLFFGQVLGRASCDVTARATALFTPTTASGFVGLSGVHLGATNDVNSYSSTTGAPGGANLLSSATVGSNGPITAGNTVHVYGNLLKGPAATLSTGSGFYLSGNQIAAGGPMAYAATESPTVGGMGSNSSGSTSLPAGTYNYSSISISSSSTITCTGPVTVYITGNLTFGNNCTLTAYQNKPTNLKIRFVGSGNFTAGNNLDLTADVYMPGGDFNVDKNSTIRGRVIADTITTSTGTDVYYDTALGASGAAGGTVSTVK